MKYLPFIVIAVIVALTVFTPLPAASEAQAEESAAPNNALVQTFVDLDDNVELGITGVVVWLVSWFVAQLIFMLPFLKFLEDFKQPLALALAAQLIAFIEHSVPDAFGGIAVAGVVLLLAVLAYFKIGEALTARGVRGFK